MTNIVFLILNYKTYQDTIRVTNELLETSRDNFRILIVDNESPNESYKIIKQTFVSNPFVDVIASHENGGYAKGNNYGLHYMKKYDPEYVCIINNDVHFTWDTIDGLIEMYHSLERPAIVTPIQLLPDKSRASFPELSCPSFLTDLKGYFFIKKPTHEYKDSTGLNAQKVDIIPGAFLFIKYSVFENVGFFNESTFLFCEERFTYKKTSSQGLCNYICLDYSYVHEHSKTISTEANIIKQNRYLCNSQIAYTKQYRSFPIVKSLLLELSFLFFSSAVRISKQLKRFHHE